MKHQRNFPRLAAALAATAILTACASTVELDPQQVQRAEIAIDEAKEVNAGQHAAGTLSRAEERLMMAREAADDGDEQRARFLVEEALVLAELAEARALEQDSEQSLARIQRNLDALQQQIN